MQIEFDPVKGVTNAAKHGVSLAAAEQFDWDSALVREDLRQGYAEPRFQAVGFISDRLHVLVFCLRGDVIRVISLRKANEREVKGYVSKS